MHLVVHACDGVDDLLHIVVDVRDWTADQQVGCCRQQKRAPLTNEKWNCLTDVDFAYSPYVYLPLPTKTPGKMSDITDLVWTELTLDTESVPATTMPRLPPMMCLE